jgi:hypothetical protein
LRRAVIAVGLLVLVATLAGLPARAGRGSQTVADEPEYLLTAGALFQHGSLDVSRAVRAETWKPYHQADLPSQSVVRADGSQLSPHDPLLPVVLAIPMGLGGWVAAKATLALLAAALAGLLVWTAVIRFEVPVTVAAVVVAAFGVVPPLVSYGTQVYPELPAALVVTAAVAALAGPLGRSGRWGALAAVVALPWLAVKYAPVAVAFAAVLGWMVWRRGQRRDVAWLAGAAAVVGVAFLAFHRVVYGGWTVYAAGDHFTGGELTVVGAAPDYPARSIRLVGLLVDHDFGLLAWAPAYLLVIPALAALVRRRPPGAAVLALPLAAGWLNATYVALTMAGWWWPGRQVVVVLPLAVLAVAWWAGTVVDWARVRGPLVVASVVGVVTWAWIVVRVVTSADGLIVDFAQIAGPVSAAWRLLLPDDRVLAPIDLARYSAWVLALAALATWGWHTAAPAPRPLLFSDPLTHTPERVLS